MFRNPKRFDVALSYAHENRPYVSRVADFLKRNRIRVFFDEDEDLKTHLWGKSLLISLDQIFRIDSDYVVIFISKHYKRKKWTQHELKSAVLRAVEERREYILPASFDDTDLEDFDPSLSCFDIKNQNPYDLAQKIIDKIYQSKPSWYPLFEFLVFLVISVVIFGIIMGLVISIDYFIVEVFATLQWVSRITKWGLRTLQVSLLLSNLWLFCNLFYNVVRSLFTKLRKKKFF